MVEPLQLLDEKLTTYLQGLIPERSSLLQAVEAEAKRDFIPILDLEATSFLQVLLMLKQPKRILEIGTAIGYSALLMAETAKDASIITIERDMERASEAKKWIEQSDFADRISLHIGDAFEVLEEYRTRQDANPYFDFIFLDAAKGQYMRFLDYVLPMLKQDGVLLSDNILFQGYVFQEGQVKHKLRTMVNRLREYNSHIASHPRLKTTFLPLGDGMAVSIRK